MIRILLGISAFEVRCGANGFDQFGRENGFLPSFDGGLFKGFVVIVGPVRPEVAFQIMPQIFDRIEFGTVRG